MTPPKIYVEAGRLDIQSLSVEDHCTAEYIVGIEPENRVAAVQNCIQLGARALSFAADQSGTILLTDAMKQSADSHKIVLETLSKQTQENVARTAEELPKKLHTVLKLIEKDLSKTLDPQSASSIVGKLQAAIVAGIAKETEKLSSALDLRNPTSAFSQLNALEEKRQARIEEELRKIVDELKIRAAAGAVMRKTTGKGVTFEDTLEAYVANESRPRHDLVTRTSKLAGNDNNEKGDITIEIAANQANGPGLNLVVEAKDSQISFPALVRDVEKAMSNRGAAFGIGVTTNPDITRGASLIVPVGDDKLIICAPAVCDGEFEFLGVALGLEMARWKAIMGRVAPTQHMDLNRINAHVSAAFAIMKRFTEAKRKITSVKTAVDETWIYLDLIRVDLQAELGNLRTAIAEELQGDGGSDAATAA